MEEKEVKECPALEDSRDQGKLPDGTEVRPERIVEILPLAAIFPQNQNGKCSGERTLLVSLWKQLLVLAQMGGL